MTDKTAKEKSALVVVFFGPPGVGKGTVATRLAEEMGFEFVSSGDLLRENVRRGTELGREASGYMNSGKLVPDRLVTEMVMAKLEGPGKRFFLDGFPRTDAQAEELSRFLAARGLPLLVVDLEAEDAFLEERLTARLICRDCGAIYHRLNLPPRREGLCDKCGGELYQRDDDRAEVVRERLGVYHQQSVPLRRYYREKGLARTMRGDGKLEDTLVAVRSAILDFSRELHGRA